MEQQAIFVECSLPLPPQLTTFCAWCLVERGETPAPGDSHGICARHADQILAEYRIRKQHRRASQYIAEYCSGKQNQEAQA